MSTFNTITWILFLGGRLALFQQGRAWVAGGVMVVKC